MPTVPPLWHLNLARAAIEYPHRLALMAKGHSLTFAELAARVRPLAATFATLPQVSTRPIALHATNRIETLLALYACIERGIPFVPIHPRLTPKEVETLCEDANPALLLDDNALSTLATATLQKPLPPASPESSVPLAILYTSGTTGRPKGAILSRAAFAASAEGHAANLGWKDNDRWLLCLPVCHIGGLSVVTRCLLARTCVVLEPRFDPDAILETLARAQVTLLSVVPTMLPRLLERDRANALAGLRALLVGGAAAPFPLLKECAARGIQALSTYGLTEACSQVATQTPRTPPHAVRGVGRVLPGLTLELRNAAGVPVPQGEVGSLHLRGASLMTGYLGAPPLGSAWFDTGDLGSLDAQGHLHLHTRRTDLIVTGGENVYPAEVEQALEQCVGVAQAVVFGVPDATWGARVAAVLAPAQEGIDLPRVLQTLCLQLATHKRPRLVAVTPNLPLLPNGKLDRKAAQEEWTPNLHPWPS